VLGVFHSPFLALELVVEGLTTVSVESHTLINTVTEYSLQIQMLQEDARENVRLRQALMFDRPAARELLPARVLEVSGGRPPRSVLIDRGAVDSVKVHQTVINREGLIGQVLVVMEHTAVVQLLTDPENRVAARIASGRERGIVRFQPGQGLILDYFPNQGQVQVGDTVISSGLGKNYPVGLRIATVIEVVRPENRPDCDVRLKMCANLRSIEELFVLLPESQ
jgi:rod shape-determining protein MreC